MSNATKLISDTLFIIVPTIEFGGTFLLRLLSGEKPQFTEFQRSMFRAGHAHAGVLVILALVAQIFMDQARLPETLGWAARIGFVLAALLVSGGFFGSTLERINPVDSSRSSGSVYHPRRQRHRTRRRPDPGPYLRGVIAPVPRITRLFREFCPSNPPESPSQEESSLASMPDILETRCRSNGPPASPQSIAPPPVSRSSPTVSAVA